jgi:hypothetical protein
MSLINRAKELYDLIRTSETMRNYQHILANREYDAITQPLFQELNTVIAPAAFDLAKKRFPNQDIIHSQIDRMGLTLQVLSEDRQVVQHHVMAWDDLYEEDNNDEKQ